MNKKSLTIEETIERLRYKAENIKAHIEPEFFNDVADRLEELGNYKAKMEMQWLHDMDNPLEPLKLASALESEIIKYSYRKEHKPSEINMLDYTIMYALKHCLNEQTKKG